MALVNTTKPSSSYSNTARPDTGQTWATWNVQWQNETRTWGEMGSLIDNSVKISSSITNVTRPS